MDALSRGPPKVVSGSVQGGGSPRNVTSQAGNAAAGTTSMWHWARSGSVNGAFVRAEAFHTVG